MSDINISISGERSDKIHAVHAISKARRIAEVDRELVGETDPDRIDELQQLRLDIENEGVNWYILSLFRGSALAEMKNFKLKELESAARSEIRQLLKAFLDQFGGI